MRGVGTNTQSCPCRRVLLAAGQAAAGGAACVDAKRGGRGMVRTPLPPRPPGCPRPALAGVLRLGLGHGCHMMEWVQLQLMSGVQYPDGGLGPSIVLAHAPRCISAAPIVTSARHAGFLTPNQASGLRLGERPFDVSGGRQRAHGAAGGPGRWPAAEPGRAGGVAAGQLCPELLSPAAGYAVEGRDSHHRDQLW